MIWFLSLQLEVYTVQYYYLTISIGRKCCRDILICFINEFTSLDTVESFKGRDIYYNGTNIQE